ncbi:MAG: DUF885 domain-containing protein [Planctomycetota bacterium]
MYRLFVFCCVFFILLEAQTVSEDEQKLIYLLTDYGLISADSNPHYDPLKKWFSFLLKKDPSQKKSSAVEVYQKLIELNTDHLSRAGREDWFFFLNGHILPKIEKADPPADRWNKPLRELFDKPLEATLEGKFYIFATLKNWNETQQLPTYFESKDLEILETLLKKLQQNTSEALQGVERWEEVLKPISKKTQQILKQAFFRANPAYQNYIEKLKYQQFVDQTPEEILAFGEKEFKETWREIQEFAKTLEPVLPVEKHFQRIREMAPPLEHLVEKCQELTDNALHFIQEKNLVTVPEKALNLPVRGVAPSGNMPYGFYQPFQAYCVPIPDQKALTPEELKDFMGDFNIYRLTVIALHEAYPGHHLQYCKEIKSTRSLFRDYFTSFYVEGWGLYCEDMMYRHGYYQNSYIRMAQLKMKLWRCARVILDIKMHLFGMKVNEAAEFLEKKVFLSSQGALQEATRYLYNPLQPMSYLVGCHDIQAIQEEVRQLLGEHYSEKEFHDEFLSYGPLPLRLIRLHLLHWAKNDQK